MKSRIGNANKILVGYQLKDIYVPALMELCRNENIRFKSVGKEALGIKVGNLAGFDGFDSESVIKADLPDDECLIISGFSSRDMNRLLSELRKKEIKIDLKCVVTSHNQGWILKDLINELKREHEAMNKGKK